MSISEFARKVDIPQQTLSRYLLCQREITLSNLCKIADFFDEDIENPGLANELLELTSELNDEDLHVLIAMAKRMKNK